MELSGIKIDKMKLTPYLVITVKYKRNIDDGIQCFGPLAYNLCLNDPLYLVCDIYNYVDDNTISILGNDVQNVLLKIQLVSNILMNWLKKNYFV